MALLVRTVFLVWQRQLAVVAALLAAPWLCAAVDAPANPAALPEVRALLRFLDESRGQYILSGQQEFPGWSDESKDDEFDWLLASTGKRPVIRGFDFLFYTHSAAGRAGQRSTQRALAWSRAGGVVTFCSHFFVDLGSPAGNPQFYSPGASGSVGTTFDIREAVKDGTPENREFLAKLDLMAGELKKLRDARVPVLWRPFHECSGGWFWWGAKGAAPFIQAWRIMFERYTALHQLTNLIWVYNPTGTETRWREWYPGDEYVDVVSFDYYPTAGTHPPHTTDYQAVRAWKPGKVTALSEVGAMPDPDRIASEGAWWSYFCTWNGFQRDPAQNSADFVRRMYAHDKVITLEEFRPLWAAKAFTLTSVPAPGLVVAGAPLELTVTANDSNPVSYQWSRDGAPLAGATAASYRVPAATLADAGSYTVAVTGSAGTLTSLPARIDVAAGDDGRIVNLSVRAAAGADAQALIPGFVVADAGNPKPIVVRAVGPALIPFGVADAVADPVLELNSAPAIANDDWSLNATGTATDLAAAFTQVFAFALPEGSRDSAVLASVSNGLYTARITGKAGSPGIALAEVYDRAWNSPAHGRLVNISARANVSAGRPIIAGFSIHGQARTVMVRAVGGSTLSGYGVQGALPNPRLTLYRAQPDGSSTEIAANDDWAGGDVSPLALQPVFDRAYAFQIDPTTRDSVLLLTLQPGSYTAQVTSADPANGIALVEVYEIR